MKKLGYILTLGAVMVIAAAATARAQTIISVNFQTSDTDILGASDTTGATAAANWNNVSGPFTYPFSDSPAYSTYTGDPIVLNDSTGTATNVQLTAFGNGIDNPDSGLTAGITQQQLLFDGGLNIHYGPDSSFTVTGLDQFTSYSLTLYYSAAANQSGIFNASGSALGHYVAGEATPDSGFTQSDSTTPGVFASGNYTTFSGLTAASESVSFTGGDHFALVGYQIVGSNDPLSVPEPSTWALMLGGMAMLVVVQRVRRQGSKI